jgi:fumarate reductase subunit C
MLDKDNYIIEGLIDKKVDGKKSRIPARLDFLQSATGLVLAIFIKFHIIFVSSILISNEFMHQVEIILAGGLFVDGGTPKFIIGSSLIAFFIIVIHAILALRKFPNSYRQYRNFRSHTMMYNHSDTKLWALQVLTGFVLFFVASIHLYQMALNPSDIGPYQSSDRIFTDGAWMLYIVLLIAVELHATIGLYRLIVKWGWFEGKNYKESRKRFQKFRNIVIAFYLVLGLLSLGAYMKTGYDHKDNYGEKYISSMENR